MKFKSYNLEQFDQELENPFFKCHIFWARIVSHENESLLTQYTKHTFYEIQYAIDGHIGMQTGGGNRLDIAESDFVVIPPDTYHQVVDADSAGARFIMAFSIVFKDPELKAAASGLESLCPRPHTPSMGALLQLIFEKNIQPGKMRRHNLSVLLESLLFEIIRPSGEQPFAEQADGSQRSPKAEQILLFIKSCNGIGIKVADLSQKFSISQRHLRRILVEETGHTPKQIIDHEKLRKIEEYIVSTKLSLCEIAELCGFCDEYAMNKFFKQHNMTNLSDFKRLTRGI